MRKKRNDLRRSALFKKGRNMQIQAKVQLPKALPDFEIGNDGVMFGN